VGVREWIKRNCTGQSGALCVYPRGRGARGLEHLETSIKLCLPNRLGG